MKVAVFTGWLFGMAATLATAAAYEEPLLPSRDPQERELLEGAGWVAGTAEDGPVGEVPSPEIPEKFLPAYFAERPTAFLIDPQGLLGAEDFRDRLSFLNYHASDSSIDLYVYMIGGDQEIPGQLREEEMSERFFSEGRPAAIVFYYLGAPQRSALYLSPSITDAISAVEQQRALASSVMLAFEKLDPAEQIESFLVQMSIRIYWMERMLSGAPPSTDELPMVSRRVEMRQVKELSKQTNVQSLQVMAMKYAFPAAISLVVLLLLIAVNHRLRRRVIYRFPEFEVEPRLGGTHAAGVGAVISFASAHVPPASQRKQVPDYLRRA